MTFWHGKKVLITGHTGFKGSWLSLWLQKLNAVVTGYSLIPPTEPNLFTLTDAESGMTSIIGDIRHFSYLHDVLKKHRPEIIFHMAAQPLVRYSYQEPIETYATNVMGTLHLLEAARQTESVKAIVNITTDKCYENKEWYWGYRENDRLGGHDPYSNSKACSELVTSAYRHSYFQTQVGLASARAGNVIGGGDWAVDRLIPDIMRALIKNEPIKLRNPQSTRPWQHVLEPLSGYLLLAERLYEQPSLFAEAWNFGPDERDIQPVRWIAEYLVQQWGDQAEWMHEQSDSLHEAKILSLDCSKAKTQLKWQPRWNLELSLKNTVEWYQAYQMKKNLRELTLEQIERFEKTAES